jgi:diguanylate cyclase (GGDEF)-like protein
MDKKPVSMHFQTFLYSIVAVRLLLALMYFYMQRYSLAVYCIGALLLFGYLIHFQLPHNKAALMLTAIFAENSLYCILASLSLQKTLGVCTSCFVYILLAFYFQYVTTELHNRTRLVQILVAEQIATFLLCLLISIATYPMSYTDQPLNEFITYWFHMLITLVYIIPLARLFSQEIRSIHRVLDVQHETMQIIAHIDPLTGLLNHEAAKLYFDEVTQRSTNDSTLTLILCAITNLKKINVDYGHDCGDYVLHETASLLHSAPFQIASLARWQSEEFLLFFPETPEDAESYMMQLTNIMKNHHFMYQTIILPVDIAFGMSQYEKGNTLEDLLDLAIADLIRRRKTHMHVQTV